MCHRGDKGVTGAAPPGASGRSLNSGPMNVRALRKNPVDPSWAGIAIRAARRGAVTRHGLKVPAPRLDESEAATQSLYESGSVVCGIIPQTPVQAMENGMMRWATRFARMNAFNRERSSA